MYHYVHISYVYIKLYKYIHYIYTYVFIYIIIYTYSMCIPIIHRTLMGYTRNSDCFLLRTDCFFLLRKLAAKQLPRCCRRCPSKWVVHWKGIHRPEYCHHWAAGKHHGWETGNIPEGILRRNLHGHLPQQVCVGRNADLSEPFDSLKALSQQVDEYAEHCVDFKSTKIPSTSLIQFCGFHRCS